MPIAGYAGRHEPSEEKPWEGPSDWFVGEVATKLLVEKDPQAKELYEAFSTALKKRREIDELIAQLSPNKETFIERMKGRFSGKENKEKQEGLGMEELQAQREVALQEEGEATYPWYRYKIDHKGQYPVDKKTATYFLGTDIWSRDISYHYDRMQQEAKPPTPTPATKESEPPALSASDRAEKLDALRDDILNNKKEDE